MPCAMQPSVRVVGIAGSSPEPGADNEKEVGGWAGPRPNGTWQASAQHFHDVVWVSEK
jgi:hypothetical protein